MKLYRYVALTFATTLFVQAIGCRSGDQNNAPVASSQKAIVSGEASAEQRAFTMLPIVRRYPNYQSRPLLGIVGCKTTTIQDDQGTTTIYAEDHVTALENMVLGSLAPPEKQPLQDYLGLDAFGNLGLFVQGDTDEDTGIAWIDEACELASPRPYTWHTLRLANIEFTEIIVNPDRVLNEKTAKGARLQFLAAQTIYLAMRGSYKREETSGGALMLGLVKIMPTGNEEAHLAKIARQIPRLDTLFIPGDCGPGDIDPRLIERTKELMAQDPKYEDLEPEALEDKLETWREQLQTWRDENFRCIAMDSDQVRFNFEASQGYLDALATTISVLNQWDRAIKDNPNLSDFDAAMWLLTTNGRSIADMRLRDREGDVSTARVAATGSVKFPVSAN